MFDPEDGPDLELNVARRLARTRAAMGMDQEEFGGAAGLSQPRYNQYETGARCLTLKAAMALCKRYHLPLDWLYLGDPSGLPKRIVDALRSGTKS